MSMRRREELRAMASREEQLTVVAGILNQWIGSDSARECAAEILPALATPEAAPFSVYSQNDPEHRTMAWQPGQPTQMVAPSGESQTSAPASLSAKWRKFISTLDRGIKYDAGFYSGVSMCIEELEEIRHGGIEAGGTTPKVDARVIATSETLVAEQRLSAREPNTEIGSSGGATGIHGDDAAQPQREARGADLSRGLYDALTGVAKKINGAWMCWCGDCDEGGYESFACETLRKFT